MVAIGAAIILAAPPAAAIGLQLMTGGAVCFGLGAATKADATMRSDSNARLEQGENRDEIKAQRWSMLGKNVAKEVMKPW